MSNPGETTPVVEHAVGTICCHLRSNGMYVNCSFDANATGMPGTGDGNFWCLKTMHLFGPDSELVNRELCRPGRNCFETV